VVLLDNKNYFVGKKAGKTSKKTCKKDRRINNMFVLIKVSVVL